MSDFVELDTALSLETRRTSVPFVLYGHSTSGIPRKTIYSLFLFHLRPVALIHLSFQDFSIEPMSGHYCGRFCTHYKFLKMLGNSLGQQQCRTCSNYSSSIPCHRLIMFQFMSISQRARGSQEGVTLQNDFLFFARYARANLIVLRNPSRLLVGTRTYLPTITDVVALHLLVYQIFALIQMLHLNEKVFRR